MSPEQRAPEGLSDPTLEALLTAYVGYPAIQTDILREHGIGVDDSAESTNTVTSVTPLQVELDSYVGYPAVQASIEAEYEARGAVLEEINQAAARLEGVANRTSVVYSAYLSQITGNMVYTKLESEQPIGAFKIRGTYNYVAQMNEVKRSRGLCGASAGNAGQGLALSGQQFNIPVTIFVPKDTPQVKIDGMEKYGAEVHIAGTTYDEAREHCEKWEETTGMTQVPAFDDEQIIYGQATAAKELFEDVDNLEYIFVQGGGGSLAAGVLLYAKAVHPHVKVILVEPEGNDAIGQALTAGRRVILDEVDPFVASLGVKQVGEQTFKVITELVDGHMTVQNTQIKEAMLLHYKDHGTMPEAGGAVGIAGAKAFLATQGLRNKKVAVICSGSNIDPKDISELLKYGAQLLAA